MRVGDIGHIIQYTCTTRDLTTGEGEPLDLSASGPFGVPATLTYVFQGPANATTVRFTRTPTVYAATSGIIRWTNTLATDFPVAGIYRMQPVLTFAGSPTPTFAFQIVEIRVEEAL